MRLEGRKGSKNIDDRRGGGGMSRGTKTAGGIGLGSIIIAIIVMLLGGNPMDYLGVANGPSVQQQTPRTAPAKDLESDDPNFQIVSKTLYDNEQIWGAIFPQAYNRQYQEPVLVVFEGLSQSACGRASASTGPFYCPADQKVYIDLQFADLLRQRFRAPGDFALAYVVAHEVGHHIQNLLGYSQQVSQARRRSSEKQANAMSVRLELQADYLAGVWAHYAGKYDENFPPLLEEGDIQEALKAASAIGDDAIQKQSQGYVVPDSFTHGTSAQRVKYFSAGYQSGDAKKETLDYFFSAREL